MDLETALIVLVGTMLLRVAGRKSIAQMTLAQTVIMIAIGSLLIQPVAEDNVWETFGVAAVLVLTLVIVEYGQLKINWLEKLITGTSKTVIQNGKLVEENMRNMRLTVDQLELQLRMKNITQISDVEFATLGPNGQIGFLLIPDKRPAAVEDIEQLRREIQSLKQIVQTGSSEQQTERFVICRAEYSRNGKEGVVEMARLIVKWLLNIIVMVPLFMWFIGIPLFPASFTVTILVLSSFLFVDLLMFRITGSWIVTITDFMLAALYFALFSYFYQWYLSIGQTLILSGVFAAVQWGYHQYARKRRSYAR